MPPTSKPDLQFIELADFRAGIWDDWMAAGGTQPAPDGAAQLTGTYGCIASPAGGLMPGPALVHTATQAQFDAGASPRTYIVAFRNVSPVVGGAVTNTDPDLDQQVDSLARLYAGSDVGGTGSYTNNTAFYDQPFFGFHWFDGTNTTKIRIDTYKFWKNPVTTFNITNMSQVLTPPLPFLNGFVSIDISHANTATPALPGDVCVGCVAANAFTLGDYVDFDVPLISSLVFQQSPPGTDATATLNFNVPGSVPVEIVAHQNRFLALMFGAWGFGSNFAAVGFEDIAATQPNDFSNFVPTPTGALFRAQFVAENPTGIGAWISTNASELFVVKRQNGGYTMRGPYETPTIVNLPGINSTGEARNQPALTPQGVVYGTDHGVFVWNGGNTSQNISPMIDGWFWKTPYMEFSAGMKGRFGYAYPFIFAPNNFIYDIRTQGWFRLGNLALLYSYYDNSMPNRMLCVPNFLSTTQTTLCDWYDTTQGQSTFQWVGQPFQKSRSRYLEFRQVDCTAQGVGTITVTLTGLAGVASQPQTITVNSPDRPTLYSLPISCKGTDIYATILSTSGGTAAAPRCKFRFGYHEVEEARG